MEWAVFVVIGMMGEPVGMERLDTFPTRGVCEQNSKDLSQGFVNGELGVVPIVSYVDGKSVGDPFKKTGNTKASYQCLPVSIKK